MTSPKHFAYANDKEQPKEVNLSKEQQVKSLDLLHEYLEIPKGPEPEKRAARDGYFYRVEQFLKEVDPRDSN